jgi:amino acid adenylation domain-containing protein
MSSAVDRIARLSPEKLEILLQSLKRKDTGRRLPIKRRGRNQGRYPLSFSQRRLWFIEQLHPETSAYNMSYAWRMHGHLRVGALWSSLGEIVRRHESLGTRFPEEGGKPRQEIMDVGTFGLREVDLWKEGAERRERTLRELMCEEAERPFDLRVGPLFRATLIQLGEREYVLMMVTHHIASDGWSMGIFHRELKTLYRAYVEGVESPLRELPIGYVDYAVWQREWLTGAVLNEQVGYWRRQLGGASPVLDLPTDRSRPAMPTFGAGYHGLEIGAELSSKLREISRREGVTLFMALAAGFGAMLSRYSGQVDVVVGTPIAGRRHAELEQMIGLFVNMLALRVDLREEPTFRELLKRVREACLGAYAHQDVPFEKLVEELQPERDLSRNPLFQVVFALQNAPREEMELSGLKLNSLNVSNRLASYDLTVQLIDGAGGIHGWIEYQAELFRPETISRVVGHYINLLESAATNVDQGVNGLGLLSPWEKQEIEVEWNDTRNESGVWESIDEVFEGEAGKRPDGIAVVYEGEQTSYGELNERANVLANHLRMNGVTQETIVGISVPRSTEMVVGTIGILKAGGAYLPLDMSQPGERVGAMLEDSGAGIVVAAERLKGALEGYEGRVLCIDSEWEEMGKGSDSELAKVTDGESLAYVMYTSGSTGRPKGVGVNHKGVVRLVKGGGYVDLERGERVLQFAPATFDAATFEIWGALLNGGRLVVAGEQPASIEELGEEIEREQISTMWLTAGLFQQMVDVKVESLRGIRQLLAGGDVLSVTHARRLMGEYEGRTTLINGYGPTEGTTFTCCHRVRRREEIGERMPIGRAIVGTQVYIFDGSLEVVPIGVIGELYIGGDGVARSYLKRPELTSERFVPDGVSGELGGRVYRTGDLVRYGSDGRIEFVGRFDHQVKIRGYRVELGEIEWVLRQYWEVLEAVVVAREEEPGDKRLVAYVVGEEGVEPSVGDIQKYLREKLPGYMVPGAYVVLEEMPLTETGKVDRRALPAAHGMGAVSDERYVAPRTPLEELVGAIWCDVLNLHRVGIHDNFFAIGGHSLRATQVVSRIREMLDVEIPLRALFESPTVSGLTIAIVQGLAARADAGLLDVMLDELDELDEMERLPQDRVQRIVAEGSEMIVEPAD